MPALSGELLPALTHTTAPPGGPDAAELARQWLIGFRSPNTRRAYEIDLGEWLSYCQASGLDPLAARRFHAEAWMRGLEADHRELAPDTVARKLAAVSSFYSWAVSQEHATRNPATGIKRPARSVDPTRQSGLTFPQLRQLLTAADTSPHPYAARESFALRLMALNGLRVGSVCAASVGDLGMYQDSPGITVPVKGGKRQFTPLAPSTLAARDRWLARLQAEPWIRAGVIVHRSQLRGPARSPLFTLYGTAERATPSSFGTALTRLARDAGLPEDVATKVTPHWLRHTFVTLALVAGVELQHVQDGAGHSSPAITRGYDGNRDSVENHATHTLDRVLSGL